MLGHYDKSARSEGWDGWDPPQPFFGPRDFLCVSLGGAAAFVLAVVAGIAIDTWFVPPPGVGPVYRSYGQAWLFLQALVGLLGAVAAWSMRLWLRDYVLLAAAWCIGCGLASAVFIASTWLDQLTRYGSDRSDVIVYPVPLLSAAMVTALGFLLLFAGLLRRRSGG
jgi:hypothetical protein